VFIVEAVTKTGKVCERYATHEEARRRAQALSAECVIGLPLIYQELADGSQRLVREDGKPLQWHRMTEDVAPAVDAPIPLSEETLGLFGPGKGPRLIASGPEPKEEDEDEPLAFPE
jgi:hypothetical protein